MPFLTTAFLTFVLAFAVSVLLTPLVIRLCWGLLALDRPDTRKVHLTAVPRLGGIAVLGGFTGGVALTLWLTGYQGNLFGAFRYHWIGWIGALAGLFLCGLVDDLYGLGPSIKLVVQAAAAVGVFAAGFRIDSIVLPAVGPLKLGLLALPVTVLWVVAVTNAINLIDGLDGLATGIGFLITLTVAVISYHGGVFPVTVIAAALAGSLLGFLPYNFKPAQVFLGDSGSQFLGLTLAVISIRGTQKSATIVAVLAPVLVLGLPILDTVLVVLRRTWRIHGAPGIAGGLRTRFALSRGLFQADREHIHHNLLELGLSDRKAVLVLYLASAGFCAAAFGLEAFTKPSIALILAAFVAVATMFVKVLAVRRRPYAPPRVLAAIAGEEAPEVRSAGPTVGVASVKAPGAGEC